MSITFIATIAQAVADADRLTLSEIVADIPHDGPAIVVYVMLLASVGLIWKANRKKRV